MSAMRLRDSIRAPVRYGEDDLETPRQGSLRREYDDAFDDSMELGESGRPRPQKRRKPNTVPFNPNLPPAAFPSLDRPQPSRDSSSRQDSDVHAREDRRQTNDVHLSPPSDRSIPPLAPSGIEQVPMSQFDNHIASNNMDNPVYARNVNMASMADMDATSFGDMATSSDSDDNGLPNATQVLLDAIPRPKWNDLHPAMQVEIVENTMKHHTWRRVCDLLGLGPEERAKFMDVLGIRNKQIERENKRLEQMRRKQRNALMNIDNSDLKRFQPPPQLVLKRIARETTRSLVVTKYTDLLMCQAHDVLKARQYLHQHGLPRRYAGDWGDSLVVLRESEDSTQEPDKFEWEENLRFIPPPQETQDPMNPFADPVSNAKSAFIQSFGPRGTMNPRDLVRRSSDPEPIVDWSKYFERNPDSSWNTQRVRHEGRHGGLLKVNVGTHRAAEIQQYDETGVRPQGWPLPRRQLVSGKQMSSPPASPGETPSKPPRGGPAQPSFQLPSRPFSRVLSGTRRLAALAPSESQSRFQEKMHQARLERMQAHTKELRRKYNLTPALRVDGVGVGMRAPSRDTQPLSASHLVENNMRSDFFARADRGLTMRNIDHLMDEFICFDPVVEREESEPEQPDEEAVENNDEQPTSTDISSLTDVSMDDVMLVPTDGCSPSQ